MFKIEATKLYREARSVSVGTAREPFFTGRVLLEGARELLTAPRPLSSALDVDREKGTISVRREVRIETVRRSLQ